MLAIIFLCLQAARTNGVEWRRHIRSRASLHTRLGVGIHNLVNYFK
jgi:hypothetical protein